MTNDRHCSKDDLRFLKYFKKKRIFNYLNFILNRNHVSLLRGFPIEHLSEIPNAIQHCHYGYIENQFFFLIIY
jgi:hypothetical protein